jgi:hypothetical protein
MDQYFNAMNAMQEAVKSRDFETALDQLKIGLASAPSALNAMRQEWGSAPPSVPFVEPTAGAVAALFNDNATFDLMEAVARQVGNEADVDRYRKDAALVLVLRMTLEKTSPQALSSLKKGLDPEDRGRASRLISWMEKNRELAIAKVGTDTSITWGRPTIAPKYIPTTFRAGALAIQPAILDFSKSAAPLGRDVWRGTPEPETYELEGAKAATSAGRQPRATTTLPTDSRLPGIMRTVILRDRSWLVATPKKTSDGLSTTQVFVKDLNGTAKANLLLDHGAHRAFRAVGGDHVITVDTDLIVRILDVEGVILASLSLWETPEVNEVLDDAGRWTEKRNALRTVDVSVERREIAFSIMDAVFRFGFDGQLVSAFRLPGVPSNGFQWDGAVPPAQVADSLSRLGLPASVTARQVASLVHSRGWVEPSAGLALNLRLGGPAASTPEEYLTDLFSGIGRDWVYFVRFAEFDDSIWVSTYSGMLLDVTPGGSVEGAWILPGSINDLLEFPGEVIIVSTGSSVCYVAPGKEPMIRPGMFGTGVVSPRVLAKRDGRTITIVSLVDWQTTTFELDQDFRAAYPTADGVRIESVGKAVDVSV